MANVKLAAVSMVLVPDKSANLAKMCKYIGELAEKGANLVAFPELSLCGIPHTFSMLTSMPDASAYFVNSAELVPEGPSVQVLMEKAKEHDVYISWTMVEKDKEYCDVFYNTAVLVGPEGFVGKYRKIHQPGTERLFFHPGKEINVFDTKIGKIGLMICFDRWWPETARCLKLKGAEIIVEMSCWPGAKRGNSRDEDQELNFYTKTAFCRTLENSVVFVDANGASPENVTTLLEGLECGHAGIYSPEGYILDSTGWDEGVAIAEIDPQAAIANCFATYGLGNMNSIRDLRPDIYGPIYESRKS